jgi:hypothetical protein
LWLRKVVREQYWIICKRSADKEESMESGRIFGEKYRKYKKEKDFHFQCKFIGKVACAQKASYKV